jgi:hypothetical protein
MAVVALGIVMSAERTCISPEVQGLVHHFWEMLGYLGNTVLFLMVGIVISETAINSITLEDIYYLIFLYFALNIARFLMIVVLSPFLSHVGYGLSWKNMMVMTWGGLRGAVGICLSLEVFKDRDLCENITVGPKVRSSSGYHASCKNHKFIYLKHYVYSLVLVTNCWNRDSHSLDKWNDNQMLA